MNGGRWMEAWPLDPWRRAGWLVLLIAAFGGMFSTALAQITAVGAVLIAIVGAWTSRELRWERWILPDIALVVFVCARILSVAASIDPGVSARTLHAEIPFYGLYAAMTWLLREERSSFLKMYGKLLATGAVIAALVGMYRYGSGISHRAASVTSGYYTLGMYLTAVLGMVMYAGGRKATPRDRLAWVVVMGLLGAGILLTFNRIHWMIAGSTAVAVLGWRDRRLLLAVPVLATVVFMFVPSVFERFLTLFQPSGNLSERDILWSEGWKLAWDHPFLGHGTRTFPLIFPKVDAPMDPGVGSWHNDILQIHLESGLLAAVAYVVFVGSLVWKGLRMALQRRAIDAGSGVGGGLSILAATILLGGMTGIFLTDPIVAPLMLTALGAIRAMILDPANETETT